MEKKIRRGDMFYADLSFGVGSEQSGFRPVLIIQNDTGNKYSNTVIVAAITCKVTQKTKLPTHCCLTSGNGLEVPSIVLLEQIRTIDKARLRGYIGSLNTKQIYFVDRALASSIGLPFYN